MLGRIPPSMLSYQTLNVSVVNRSGIRVLVSFFVTGNLGNPELQGCGSPSSIHLTLLVPSFAVNPNPQEVMRITLSTIPILLAICMAARDGFAPPSDLRPKLLPAANGIEDIKSRDINVSSNRQPFSRRGEDSRRLIIYG